MAGDALDFIEQDPFDPELQAKYEEAMQKHGEEAPESANAIIERRRQAYARVFAPGAATQADIDIVLIDLAWFCKAYTPSYNVQEGEHAKHLAVMKDGRREVFYRILDFSRLSKDALFLKYTGATTQ